MKVKVIDKNNPMVEDYNLYPIKKGGVIYLAEGPF